jgi:hypothetical protein
MLPELARWFIETAGAPTAAAADRPRVTTQSMLGGSGRPDMILDYRDEAGNSRRVLSEHKINADLTDLQRLAYVDWQADALVLVAPNAQVYRQAGVFHACFATETTDSVVDLAGRRGVAIPYGARP